MHPRRPDIRVASTENMTSTLTSPVESEDEPHEPRQKRRPRMQQEAVVTMEACESLLLYQEQGQSSQSSELLQDSAASDKTNLDALHNTALGLCAIALAARSAFVYMFQMCLSWSVFFHGNAAGPAHLQGMLVENFFEHSQGLLLLLLLCGLVETPLAAGIRRFKSVIDGRRKTRGLVVSRTDDDDRA